MLVALMCLLYQFEQRALAQLSLHFLKVSTDAPVFGVASVAERKRLVAGRAEVVVTPRVEDLGRAILFILVPMSLATGP